MEEDTRLVSIAHIVFIHGAELCKTMSGTQVTELKLNKNTH